MPLILGTNSIKDTGFDVANSLRGDRGSSTYLYRTFSSGNRKKWTWSTWFKKSSNGNVIALFSAYPDGNNFSVLTLTDEDTLQYYAKASGSVQAQLRTSRKLRDNSAWYNLVLVYDSGNGTSGNRVRLYINGSEETSFEVDTMPSLNADSTINNNVSHNIGTDDTTGYYLDCYLAETVFIDNQALTPTSFGEFDEDTNIWKPINVSGLTFGTNGFYLDFENSGSLGADVSGNGNNFTVNNLTSIDQTTDTPTNNFCTLNPLDIGGGSYTFSNGNTTINTDGGLQSTFSVGQGKWYVEVKLTGAVTYGIGIRQQSYAINQGYGTGGKSASLYLDEVNFYKNGSSTASYGSSWSTGDIFQMAVDLDNDNIYFGKNGSWWSGSAFDSATPSTAQSIDHVDDYTFSHIAVSAGAGNVDWNFGNPAFTISSGNSDGNGYGNFEYSVPSGYYALNTKNLAEYG